MMRISSLPGQVVSFGTVHFLNKTGIPVYRERQNLTGTDQGLRNLVQNNSPAHFVACPEQRVFIIDTGLPACSGNADRLLDSQGDFVKLQS